MSRLCRLLPLFLLPLGGCEGCLGLDEYSIVPGSDASTAGRGGSSGAAPCMTTGGVVFASFRVDGSVAGGGSSGRCAVSSGAGVDVTAFDSTGNCLARARIAPQGAAVVESAPHVRHTLSSTLAVAGTFRGGDLALPAMCDASSGVVPLPATATAAFFVAKLRFDGASFCTEWSRTGFSFDPTAGSALVIQDVEISSDERIAIAGALGGMTATIEGATPPKTVTGGAFFAEWSSSGALNAATTLASAPGASDVALALASTGSSWVVGGAARSEDPACYGCSGQTEVVSAAGICPARIDAGATDGAAGAPGSDASSDGMTGAGGAADAAAEAQSDASSDGVAGSSAAGAGGITDAASEGAAGAPSGSDSPNAFLLVPPTGGSGCNRFESFGSDRLAQDVGQAAFGVSQSASGCRAFVSGLAGLDTWLLSASDPSSVLAPAGSAPDGFLARFEGGPSFACGDGTPTFSVRLGSSSNVSADRVLADGCSDGATLMAFARSARNQSLRLQRCRTASGCDNSAVTASLGSDADDQIAVLAFAGDGTLSWHAAFGPVEADSNAAVGTFMGRPHAALALDARDDVFVLLRATGPLEMHNVSGCALDGGSSGAATFIVHLDRTGTLGQARCIWARQIGD